MSRMKRTLLVTLASAWTLSPVYAGESEMNKVLNVWEQRISEYKAALSYAKTEEEKEKLLPPSPDEVAGRLWRSIRGVTGTRDAALRKADKNLPEKTFEFEEEWAAPAVIWFIQHPDALAKVLKNQQEVLSPYAYALLDSVKNKHFKSPLIGEICVKLSESTNGKVYEALEKIYTDNPSPTARSCAALAMSIMLSNPELASLEGGYARTRSKRIYYIKQALNIAPKDTMFGNVSLTDAATEEIYRLRYLSLNSIPPKMPIQTAGGQATEFPRPGKPNLIFFWSPDEEVGLSLMGKQKALLKQFPDLELYPIVPHMEKERLEQILHENNIEICYTDDEQGKAGTAYRISRIPTAILLDDRSHILYIGYPDMQLQTALTAYYDKNDSAAKPADTQKKEPAQNNQPNKS